ncbi:hypothetical protein SAMN04487946_11192 [Halobellus clavatus]|uniref:Uncharacterized protein n=1 Tax=Halobellus clavatus TaxID=660517 RepID=A0A1H3J0R8_9EURY|nr:hypothetical protein SAMN04487946_11192 [Halobellus clavatus]
MVDKRFGKNILRLIGLRAFALNLQSISEVKIAVRGCVESPYGSEVGR